VALLILLGGIGCHRNKKKKLAAREKAKQAAARAAPTLPATAPPPGYPPGLPTFPPVLPDFNEQVAINVESAPAPTPYAAAAATSAPIVIEASPAIVATFAADTAQEAQQRRLSSMLMRNTDDNEELQNMDMKQLRLKAAAMGVGEDDVEEARDSNDPRRDLTALIVAQAAKKATAEQEQARIEQERLDQVRAEEKAAAEQEARIEQERLDRVRAEEDFRQELSAMNMKQLRLKAAAVGADEDEVEEARDTDDPRRDLTALVLRLHGSGPTTPVPSQSPGSGMYRP